MSDYCRTCDRNNPDENAELLARVRELEAALTDALVVFADTKWAETYAALAVSPEERGERVTANEPWNCTRPGGCRSPIACSARAEVEPGYCLATAQAKLAAAGGAEGDTRG